MSGGEAKARGALHVRALGLLVVLCVGAAFVLLEGAGGLAPALRSVKLLVGYLLPLAAGGWLLGSGRARWGPARSGAYAAVVLAACGAAVWSGWPRHPLLSALEEAESPERSAPAAEPDRSGASRAPGDSTGALASVVKAVSRAERRGRVRLDGVTCHVDYAAGEPVRTLPLEEGADGLVLYYGLDPALRDAFAGTIEVRVAAISPGGESRELLRRELEVGPRAPAEAFRWQELDVDLSARGIAGGELRLEKRAEGEFAGRRFDLEATDLVYFSRPRTWSRRRPGELNVLLLSLDTLRADHLGVYGYRRDTTPNIDAWAADSIVFEQAISQAPWTTPSHFSMLTGTYPSENGSDFPFGTRTRVGGLPLLSELLSGGGYFPIAFTAGGAVAATFGFDRGFARYAEFPPLDGTDVEEVVDATNAWLEGHAARRFFLFVHTYEPHDPYRSAHYLREEDVDPRDERAVVTARYDGDVRFMDRHLGRLFGKLDELGLSEHTLVVLTSDHGEELGDRKNRFGRWVYGHGHTLFDELVHVPLIMRIPGERLAASRVPWQVRLIDLAPTVLEAVGLPIPEHLSGRSLISALRSGSELDLPAASESTTHGAARRSLRWRGYKYLRRVGLGQLLTDRYGVPFPPKDRLFDLEADPGEREDLAPDAPGLVESYRARLRRIFPADGGAGQRAPSGALDPDVAESLRALGYME